MNITRFPKDKISRPRREDLDKTPLGPVLSLLCPKGRWSKCGRRFTDGSFVANVDDNTWIDVAVGCSGFGAIDFIAYRYGVSEQGAAAHLVCLIEVVGVYVIGDNQMWPLFETGVRNG